MNYIYIAFVAWFKTHFLYFTMQLDMGIFYLTAFLHLRPCLFLKAEYSQEINKKVSRGWTCIVFKDSPSYFTERNIHLKMRLLSLIMLSEASMWIFIYSSWFRFIMVSIMVDLGCLVDRWNPILGILEKWECPLYEMPVHHSTNTFHSHTYSHIQAI